MTTDLTQAATKTPFDEFMLSEYNNLAQAFFNAGNGITQFFQYYLLALGVPLTAAGIVVKVSTGTLSSAELLRSTVAVPLGCFFVVIGLVGVCMATYITNLRLDALLYARAVNGIRHYFYEQAGKTSGTYRILPVKSNVPRYFEWVFFFPVVLGFALLNATYLGIGTALIAGGRAGALTIAAFVTVLAHIGIYWLLTRYREHGYLPAVQKDGDAQRSAV